MKTFKEIAESYQKDLELLETLANKSTKDKKLAKKKSALKAKKHCKGNMTPSVKVNGTNVKVTCTPKDKTKAYKMKKVARKMKANVALMRKKAKKANATKAFRK